MDFHKEWYTTKDDVHRVLISVRDGFPGPAVRDFCDALARAITGTEAQIVEVFFDDTHSVLTAYLGAPPAGAELVRSHAQHLEGGGAAGFGTVCLEITEVPRGPESSDHYNHAAYMREHVKGF